MKEKEDPWVKTFLEAPSENIYGENLFEAA